MLAGNFRFVTKLSCDSENSAQKDAHTNGLDTLRPEMQLRRAKKISYPHASLWISVKCHVITARLLAVCDPISSKNVCAISGSLSRLFWFFNASYICSIYKDRKIVNQRKLGSDESDRTRHRVLS